MMRYFPIALLATLAPAAAHAQAPTPAITSTAVFDHKALLEDLNARADGLQERIATLADRVLLLRESIVVGSIAPTRCLILHSDEMGASFALEEVTYRLDGKEILKASGPAAAERQRELEIFNGPIAPGPHEISVSMVYGGTGFGVFTYLKGYRFKIESAYPFKAAEGRLTKVQIISHAKKDITLDPKERLAVRYQTEILTHSSANEAP